MEWLNYHHLLYFWTVAKEGTICAACEKLHVTQPTISGQIRALEDALGEKLFTRVGRNLVLTDIGRVVYRYADEIFSLGHELMDTLQGRPGSSPLRFHVGVVDVLPKLVAYEIVAAVMKLPESIQLVCHEGPLTQLLARLAVHELDLVLSDSPIGSDIKVRAFSHQLGECGVSIVGTKDLVTSYRRRFPSSLDAAPFLLPTNNTSLRRSLEYWFDSEGIRPSVVGEFEDSALLKVFGQAGHGLFAVPTVIEKQVQRQYQVMTVGRVEDVQERFYAISVERQVKHPAVTAIAKTARQKLFT